jgi:hypothetical protein
MFSWLKYNTQIIHEIRCRKLHEGAVNAKHCNTHMEDQTNSITCGFKTIVNLFSELKSSEKEKERDRNSQKKRRRERKMKSLL